MANKINLDLVNEIESITDVLTFLGDSVFALFKDGEYIKGTMDGIMHTFEWVDKRLKKVNKIIHKHIIEERGE